MLALIVSPLLGLTFAVGVALPAMGLLYELRYRRERREATRLSSSHPSRPDSSPGSF
ncbi:MAG TPA: hypothetical protein VMU98_00800 [Acidimicrobiales bacterium]|nr:hypothetical protein [Acidimicrobiales bacterium]